MRIAVGGMAYSRSMMNVMGVMVFEFSVIERTGQP
jgi:hypothetical protein